MRCPPFCPLFVQASKVNGGKAYNGDAFSLCLSLYPFGFSVDEAGQLVFYTEPDNAYLGTPKRLAASSNLSISFSSKSMVVVLYFFRSSTCYHLPFFVLCYYNIFVGD